MPSLILYSMHVACKVTTLYQSRSYPVAGYNIGLDEVPVSSTIPKDMG